MNTQEQYEITAFVKYHLLNYFEITCIHNVSKPIIDSLSKALYNLGFVNISQSFYIYG
jgi:hypothetical protein